MKILFDNQVIDIEVLGYNTELPIPMALIKEESSGTEHALPISELRQAII